jgi:Family of unknown function (DUF6520)
MKRIKVGAIALCAIVGISSAFTTKHGARQTSTRTYGVVSVSGSDYNVVLWARGDKCSVQTNTTCSVKIQDNGTTYTSIPEADIVSGSKVTDALFVQ